MKKEKDRNFEMTSLGLLDDSASSANDVALQQLTRAKATVPKIIQPKPAAAITPPKAERRVFSSSPTLRQMMNDYNRHSSTLSPLKPEPKAPTKPQHGRDAEFKFDQCDLIELPEIPGRVLRPSRQSD